MFAQILEMMKTAITAPMQWFSDLMSKVGSLNFVIFILTVVVFVPTIILGVSAVSHGIKSDDARQARSDHNKY